MIRDVSRFVCNAFEIHEWFLYTTYPKGRWVLEGEDPGERLKPTHYQKKLTINQLRSQFKACTGRPET